MYSSRLKKTKTKTYSFVLRQRSHSESGVTVMDIYLISKIMAERAEMLHMYFIVSKHHTVFNL